MSSGPTIYLYEGWHEATIDTDIWDVVNPGSGTAWTPGAAGAYLRVYTVPNLNQTARLRTKQRWIAAPGIYGTDTILRRLVFEFELKLTDVGNIDNSLSFFGLTKEVGDVRTSQNIIG